MTTNKMNLFSTDDKLRFITYRDKDEIEELISKGKLRVERSLSENLLQELLYAYTYDLSIIYFWACYNDLPTLDEYFTHTEKVEFKEPTKPYILLDKERFDYLGFAIKDKYPKYFKEDEYADIGFRKLIKEGKLKEYLENFETDRDYNGAFNPELIENGPCNVYMGIMNELNLKDIISINGKKINNK